MKRPAPRSSPMPVARMFTDASWRCGAALGLLSLAAAPAAAQAPQTSPAGALSLDQAIARALAANPTIAAARLQRPVDVAAVGVARERPNPDVTFEATRETPKEALGFVLPVELGGKRGRRIGVAQAAVATGEAEADRVVADVRNDVRRAYFAAVAASQRAALALDARTLAARARDAARLRVAAGESPQLDVVQSELALVDADNEVTAAQGEATAARAELNVLLGQPADAALTLSDELSAGAVPTLEAAMAQATQANADLVVLDRRIAEQSVRRDLARALQVPDVAAGGSLTFDSPPEFQYGWRFSFSMTVPLFTRHTAGVELETAELARLRAARAALAAQIAGDVAASVARAAAAHEEMLRYQTQSVPLLAQAEQGAQASYTAGQTGLVALLDALKAIRDTRLTALQASLAFQFALADLERAIGAPLR